MLFDVIEDKTPRRRSRSVFPRQAPFLRAGGPTASLRRSFSAAEMIISAAKKLVGNVEIVCVTGMVVSTTELIASALKKSISVAEMIVSTAEITASCV